MTIQEMKKKKQELGYSNKQISELSGVPLGTVQKVFGGGTSFPRYQTIQALERVFQPHKADRVCDSAASGRFQPLRYPSARKEPGLFTVEDYFALPDDARKELIDGHFYDMAAPSTIHQTYALEICSTFRDYVMKNGGNCIPFISPIDVRLSLEDHTVVQPDVLILCDRSKLTRRCIEGPPDLVCEVMSPGSWLVDSFIKPEVYRASGVREHWLIIPEEELVLVSEFTKEKDLTQYSFKDQVPVGIWDGRCKVDFAAIYERVRFLYEME